MILGTMLSGPVFPRWDLLSQTGPRWGAGQSTVPSSLWCLETSICAPLPERYQGPKVWFKDVLVKNMFPSTAERMELNTFCPIHLKHTTEKLSKGLLGHRPSCPSYCGQQWAPQTTARTNSLQTHTWELWSSYISRWWRTQRCRRGLAGMKPV